MKKGKGQKAEGSFFALCCLPSAFLFLNVKYFSNFALKILAHVNCR
jgi:hypothetical protein